MWLSFAFIRLRVGQIGPGVDPCEQQTGRARGQIFRLSESGMRRKTRALRLVVPLVEHFHSTTSFAVESRSKCV